MEELRHLDWRQLERRLGGIASELTRGRFSAREARHPAIHAYRCHDCILVCAQLAGVDR